MAFTTEEPGEVVFLDSEGNEISNDPVWHAKRTIEARGGAVTFADSQPEALAAELKKQAADDDALGDDDESGKDQDLDEAGHRTYKELDAKALKAEADAREIDRSGFTKVGELRAALIEADNTARAEAEVEAANGGKAKTTK